MRIVVLDGPDLNPGDLDWGPSEQLCASTDCERTPPDLAGSWLDVLSAEPRPAYHPLLGANNCLFSPITLGQVARLVPGGWKSPSPMHTGFWRVCRETE